MVRKLSGKHAHINKPMGGGTAGVGPGRKDRGSGAKHTGLESPGKEADVWALCLKANQIQAVELSTETSDDSYIPQHPQRENCPQPPTKQDTWGQGEKREITHSLLKDSYALRPPRLRPEF